MEHWTGDWTQEEIRAFCKTAEKFGCGDKWGLFATYIPHRVGYQVGNLGILTYSVQTSIVSIFCPKGLLLIPIIQLPQMGKRFTTERN